MSATPSRTRVLIIGGGYGGLKAALGLQKKLHIPADITLISKHDYHYQTTLLHKVAMGTLSSRKARIFYRKLLDANKIHFIKDKIKEIHPDRNCVLGNGGIYEYDYLIIALGFRPDHLGIPGVGKHTYRLSSLNAALKLMKNIEHKFKEYTHTKNANDLSIIICGTGLTGIEFTAELATQLDELCLICGIPRDVPKITCIGRGEHILPVFDSKLASIAESKLEKLGVQIISNATIEEVREDRVIARYKGALECFEVLGNTIIWSAGVKGSEIIEKSILPHSKGRIPVNAMLQCEEYPNIYVVGDSAQAKNKDIIHAPTAQLSAQMGDYIAELFVAKLTNKPFTKPFTFRHRGTVCSIGHTDGVGMIFGRGIKGEFAALVKNTIENKWLYQLGGLEIVLKKGQFRYRTSN